MIRSYYKILLFMVAPNFMSASLGMAKQSETQTILSASKVKKKTYNKVFHEIKKILPRDLEECHINVTDIKILKHEGEFSREEWTTEVCQEEKSYVIDTFHPKGYFPAVFEKQKIVEREREIWNAVKNDKDADVWRSTLLYIDEIEAGEEQE